MVEVVSKRNKEGEERINFFLENAEYQPTVKSAFIIRQLLGELMETS